MALLEIDNLSWTPHDADSPVFEGLSLELEFGEVAALTGPSGAGKSSVLRAVVALIGPDSGEIRLDERTQDASWILEFRRKVSLVFQKPASIADSVAEDLEFARKCAGEDALSVDEQDQMLERLGIDPNFRERKFKSLSGGEQQRIQIVRSLTSRPRVVLLDEPTASLDDAHQNEVEKLLLEYKSDARALLWVSHSDEQLDRLQARRISMGGT